MPKIFELFGYPLSAVSKKIDQSRKQANCPFYGATCDGGGNRYLSAVKLSEHPALTKYFKDKSLNKIQVGVCSIQLLDSEAPWIVCPRRLLVLGHSKANSYQHQQSVEGIVLSSLGYPRGTKLGVWREVKISVENQAVATDEAEQESDENTKSFDYTFDYVIMPVGSVPLQRVHESLGGDLQKLETALRKHGYAFARRNGNIFVENYPKGNPSIFEIMTCSTSGGDEKKRTRISQAFEDAILGKPHTAPSINKRQVWARMASQLIVKSQTAIAWGGKAVWILQDNLADYISASTALDLNDYLTEHTAEVNILSLSYGEQYTKPTDSVIELKDGTLYAGPMAPKGAGKASKSFQDIVRASFVPGVGALTARLATKQALRFLTAP